MQIFEKMNTPPVCAPLPPLDGGALAAATKDVQSLNDLAREVENLIGSVSRRMFGPEPEGPMGAIGIAPVGDHAIPQLFDAIGRVRSTLLSARDVAQNLDKKL